MANYQIDARRLDARRNNELRIGHEGTVASFHRKNRFIHNMEGTVGQDAYQMKLPAPWNGLRYRLKQDELELASASRPKYKQRIVTFELELPGRTLEMVSQDRHGLRYVLTECGGECGSFDQRDFDEQDEWTADFQAPQGWSVALTAFVAWLVGEGRKMVD